MSQPTDLAGASGAPAVVLTCTKRFEDVPFAHRQAAHGGHCAHVHGHNWAFEVTFFAQERDRCGFVVDFGKLAPVREWLQQFDHALVLSDDDPERLTLQAMEDGGLCRLVWVDDPSSEGLAAYALGALDNIVCHMTGGRVRVSEVKVEEDRRNSATARAMAPRCAPVGQASDGWASFLVGPSILPA